MASETVFVDLAEYILFSKDKGLDALLKKLEELHLEFRKNKGITDINRALVKVRNPKNTYAKTEMEIDLLAIYLKRDIVKVKR